QRLCPARTLSLRRTKAPAPTRHLVVGAIVTSGPCRWACRPNTWSPPLAALVSRLHSSTRSEVGGVGGERRGRLPAPCALGFGGSTKKEFRGPGKAEQD